MAKNLFQVNGTDERGKAILRKTLKRAEVMKFFANLPVCLIGMEACTSAHHWARKRIGLGHTVRLMAPQFVKPYVKANNNDARDAEGICEAVSRPGRCARACGAWCGSSPADPPAPPDASHSASHRRKAVYDQAAASSKGLKTLIPGRLKC